MASANRITIASIAFWSFALSVAMLPIGLGGNRPIPLGITQACLAFSCVFLAFNYNTLRRVPIFVRLRWAAGLMAALLLWALFQTLPYVPQNWTHPLWHETAELLKKPVTASISVAPEDSIAGMMRLITYISGGALAYVFSQDAKRARQIVTTFWISGTVICLYGLLVYTAGLDQILWFKKWAYTGDLTATFVNRNHFAMYAGMVFTAGLALLFQSWSRALRNCKPHQRVEVIREWLLRQGLPRGVLLLITFVCLPLSHSRAGLSFSLFGIMTYIMLYQVYRRSWMRAGLVALAAVLIFAATLYLAPQISERFSTLFDDYSSQERGKVYEITWRALLDNPWLGYGINGFEPEYRLYQHNMYEEFNHAHSDVLESLIDYGFIGGFMLWSAIALLLSCLWHGIVRRRQDGMFPTLALACSIMVIAHSCVDFDLQIPGVALTWTVLLGCGLAQSWQHVEKKKEITV